MTALTFVNRATREIVYVYAIGPSASPRFTVEWQQWINERSAIGRVCVGRNLGNSYDSLDYLRGRYSPGMGWEEMGYDEGALLGAVFQREGLEFPWKPPHAWTTSMPC